jgi:hypothetical protein
MVLENPLWQQANSYPARLDRQFIEDVFDVEGVIKPSGGALLVSARAAGANMSVDVAAGRAVIKGDDQADQGSYRVFSTAVENRSIGAAPGSDSRIDLVIARVRDGNVTGGVSSDWVIEVIPGAVAAVPVAPAVPATAIPLAQILVAAGTLSIDAPKITDRRPTASHAAYAPRLYKGARVTLAAAQSIPTGTLTAVGFTSENWDAGGWHDNATNNTRLTVPAATTGYLSIVGGLHMEGTSGTFREIRLTKNGALFHTTLLAPASFGRFPFAAEVEVVPGDFIEMVVKHDAATALDAALDTFLALHYVGASA